MTTTRASETRYKHLEAESKWQKRWAQDKLYQVNDDDPRPKWYGLTMYPYTSGDLHVGHWYAMAPSDAHARLRRMQGYNVLHPMGFDAFGLPAENEAIKRGIHPYTWTLDNIENMRRQLRSMGNIYDWDREIVTCDPAYYMWNQWIFLQFYRAGLAYRSHAPANWCPSCITVLANEQVLNDGLCERCETPVVRRELEQWLFRITRYADELLDHSKNEWPEQIKTMQTNWIGRSEGAEIRFDISEYGLEERSFTTFTTRIDTIYGVTFAAMAPEHPLVEKLTSPERRSEVEAYVAQAGRQTEIERLAADKEKTGVSIGAHCVNPVNGDRVPIFIADYVLLTYGSGIVMGVPAHDQRDFEFAKKYDLPIRVVVAPPEWDGDDLAEAFIEEGPQVNSGAFDGISSSEGMQQIADHIEASGWGRRAVQYRMRDWLISRQRYWGTPIPIIYCDECGTVPVPESDLPVLLPKDAEFRPTGESPLELHEGFVNVDCPRCGRPARRETDTMDTFVDSSWYQFRYASPHYSEGVFDPEAARKWAPVDQYTGGAEHAVMHLLYARFFTKALRDIGVGEFDEPFVRLFSQGQITMNSRRMSKSRGNVIAPDSYVVDVGADAVRCYLMFLGPWDQGGEWSDSGINGISRWLNRVWHLACRDAREFDGSPVDEGAGRELDRTVHKTIRKVTEDLERFKFNTALAALMELSNHLSQTWERKGIDSAAWDRSIEKLVLLMAPMAPHIAEEMWERTGHDYSIHNRSWPGWDPVLAADEVITLVVQVNGRVRDKIDVEAGISEEEAREVALASSRVQAHLEGKQVTKVIYVAGRLVNVVAR